MTWAKYGTEFFDQLVDMDFPEDLDDACQLTHAQALHFLYSVEALDLRFKKSVLPRFATSARAPEAADCLVRCGAWQDLGRDFEVLHHADVFRQSLGYQLRERARAKDAMQKKRAKESPVPPGVTQPVTRSVMRTQTDRQANNQTSVKGNVPETDSASANTCDWCGRDDEQRRATGHLRTCNNCQPEVDEQIDETTGAVLDFDAWAPSGNSRTRCLQCRDLIGQDRADAGLTVCGPCARGERQAS